MKTDFLAISVVKRKYRNSIQESEIFDVKDVPVHKKFITWLFYEIKTELCFNY